MTKQEFIAQLKERLSGLPSNEIEERVTFYSEMIDDKIEEGYSEEDAVSKTGSLDDIVSQTVSDIPLTRIVKEKIRPKRTLRPWEIVLIVLGAPIWFSLAVAAISVIFSLYAVLWAVMAALWAVDLSFIVSGVACVAAGIFTVTRNAFYGTLAIACGCILAGSGILLFYVARAASRGMVFLTKKISILIKNMFIKKEK